MAQTCPHCGRTMRSGLPKHAGKCLKNPAVNQFGQFLREQHAVDHLWQITAYHVQDWMNPGCNYWRSFRQYRRVLTVRCYIIAPPILSQAIVDTEQLLSLAL